MLENLPDLLVLSKVVRQAMGDDFFLWEKLHPKSNGWTLKMIVLNRILVVVYTCCGCELNFTLSFFLSFFIFIVSLWVYLKKIGRLDFFSGKHLGHESLRAKPTLAT